MSFSDWNYSRKGQITGCLMWIKMAYRARVFVTSPLTKPLKNWKMLKRALPGLISWIEGIPGQTASPEA
jgi:hypothetical protein